MSESIINGLNVTTTAVSIIYGSCGDGIREYFNYQTSLVGKLNAEMAVSTSMFIISTLVWGMETLRVKNPRAAFCFIASIASMVYSGILSRSINELGAINKSEIPAIWIFSYGTSAFATLSLCERSVLIIQSRTLRHKFLVALRIILGLYTIFVIVYGIHLTYGTERGFKTTFFGYAAIPYLVLATAMNISFLYYGFKFIVPNEIKLGITNSKIKTMFNYSAFFAVVTEVLFVLVMLNLILLVDSDYRSPHGNLCLSLICLSEYCMDHGVHINSYLNIKAVPPQKRAVTVSDDHKSNSKNNNSNQQELKSNELTELSD